MSETVSKPRRRHVKRAAIFLGIAIFLLVLAAGVAALAFTGRMVQLPDWVTDRVETRLNAMIAPAAVDIAGADLFVSRQGVPQVHLREVALSDAQGRVVAQLPELNATIAARPLLQDRQVMLRRLELTDAHLFLRRAADGSLDMALGDVPVNGTGATTMVEALEQFDDAFTAPVLAAVEGISVERLALSYEDARSGRKWQVSDGLMTLDQTDEQIELRVFFSLENDQGVPSEVAVNFVSEKGTSTARFSANFSDMPAADIATQSPGLAFLAVIDAPISGAVRSGTTADGGLAPLSAALEVGGGSLRPVDGVAPIRFNRGKSYFSYDPGGDKITFDEIEVDTAGLRLKAEGHAYLRDHVAGWPSSLVTQFRFGEVLLDPEGLFAEPARFVGGAVDFKVALDPFTAQIGQVVLTDAAGVDYRGSGRVTADAKGWQVDADLSLDEITDDRLLALWPVDLVPGTRRWIANNVLSGKFFDVRAAVRLRPDQPPVASLSHEFRDARVRFLKTMPPIENGFGYATITNNAFTLVVESGHVTAPAGGRVQMAGSVMHVPDLGIKRPPAEFTLRTDSTLKDILSVLDLAPLRIMSRAGQGIDLANARTQSETKLALLLKKELKTEEVIFDVQGRLSDVESTVLVPGRVLRADELTLVADTDRVEIGGTASLDGVPFTGRWTQALGPEAQGKSRVAGTIELSERFVDAFNIGLPKGTVSGAGRGAVTIDLARDAPPEFSLSSDLDGVGLSMPGLGWSKSRASKGELRVTGALSSPPRIDAVTIDAGGLQTTGRVTLTEGGQLQTAQFDRVRLNGWLDAPVTLTGRGAGNPPAIALNGGLVDLRRQPDAGGSGGGGGAPPIDVALDRLVISDGISLTRVRGQLSRTGGLGGRFTGRVNDRAPVQATLAPARNGTAIRVLSDDAGLVLRAAGIFEKSRGGSLDLVLQPRGPKGDYDGTLSIKKTRVKGAPVLAELLTAISVVGILELLDGDGLVFNDVAGDFRLTPGALQIKRGSAVGPSLGISLAGIYDLRGNRLDMQGVISPIYMLNGIGSILTRRGEGLFGFNYAVSGPAKTPRVRVNPLSILTPGMFREIFRRPPPELAN